MRYAQIVRFVSETPWAILPSKLAIILDLIRYREDGGRLSKEEIQARLEAARPRGSSAPVASPASIGVLPLRGVLVPHAGMMVDVSTAGTDLESWGDEFDAMVNDPSVGAVILDIYSPGGSVGLVQETAARIRAGAKKKPVVGVANTMAASAAYWLASACTELSVTPSGEVGSVGVYAAHQDISAALQMEGVKMTLISAGDHKTEGNPFEPLSDEARAQFQSEVDATYRTFVADVAAGRGVSAQYVLDNFGQGRMLSAADAVKVGMADRVETLQQALGRVMAAVAPAGSGRKAFGEGGVSLELAAAARPGVTIFAGGGTLSGLSLTGDDTDVTFFGPSAAPRMAIAVPGLIAGPIQYSNTDVVDEPWDAGEELKRIPNDAGEGPLRAMHAWVDSSADPALKGSYKFPHHRVTDGKPNAANANGVRNALARVTDADIPEGDKDAVKAHLQHHLDDFNASSGTDSDSDDKQGIRLAPAPALEASVAVPAHATTNKETTVKTIEELVARQDEIRARQEELDAIYAGQLMPADAKSEFDDLQDEWQNLNATVAEMRERKAMLQQKASVAPAQSRVEIGSFSTRSPEANENIWDIAGYRARARSVDELGSLFKDGAKRALEIAQIPMPNISESKAKSHVLSLLANDTADGAFARHMLATGSDQYRRAWSKAVRGLPINGTERQALDMYALTIGTPSDGGFAIPYTLDPTVILASNGSVNPIRQISRQAQITGHQWLGVTTSDGVVASYGPELTPATDNSPTLAQPVLEVEKAQAFVPLSIEVSQDWIGVEAELSKLFADAKDVLEAQKFFSGAGHGSHEPEGVLTALIAAGGSVIVQTASVNAFARDDLYKLENEVADRFEPNSCFVANRAFYNAVRSVTDDTFNIFIPVQQGTGRDMGGNTGFQLLGYPAWRASAMSKLTSTGGEYIAILGDFEQFLVVDRIGMSVEFIPHLFDTGTGYPLGSRGLYAYWRNSSQVLTSNAFRLLKVQHT